MYRSSLIFFSFCLIIFQGCKKEETNNNNIGCNITSASFKTDVRKILDNNCMGCHNSTSASGGVVFDTHSNVKSYANGIGDKLYVSLTSATGSKKMPPGGSLPACDIEKVKVWIEGGSQDN